MEEVRENTQQLGMQEEEEEGQLIREIEQFKNVFSNNPGKAKCLLGHIKVEQNAPVVKKSYPIPFSKRAVVQKEIDRMLDNGIIELSSSPYSNPLVVVMKNDGSIRLCLDARYIDRIIIPDRESPETIDEIL